MVNIYLGTEHQTGSCVVKAVVSVRRLYRQGLAGKRPYRPCSDLDRLWLFGRSETRCDLMTALRSHQYLQHQMLYGQTRRRRGPPMSR